MRSSRAMGLLAGVARRICRYCRRCISLYRSYDGSAQENNSCAQQIRHTFTLSLNALGMQAFYAQKQKKHNHVRQQWKPNKPCKAQIGVRN